MGKGRNEQGTFQTKHIYYNLHTYAGKAMNKSKTHMQFFYEGCGTYECIYTANKSKGKSATTEYDYNVQALNRCYLSGHGATNIHSKAKEWQRRLGGKNG